jgi:hypothetical protein
MKMLDKQVELWETVINNGDTDESVSLLTEWEEIEEVRRTELLKLQQHITSYEKILTTDPFPAYVTTNPANSKKDFAKKKISEDRLTKDRNFSILFRKSTNPTHNSIYNLYYNPTM